MKKIIFILPLLYYSCTDDIIADIDALQTENAEQDAQIDSLLTVLTEQQAYIDSLNDAQNIADSLNNLTMQSYIDSLINEGELTDSLLQTYTDSLNTVQNAYIDSLHNAQQTTLEALANSALNAGFTPTEVYNGALQNYCDGSASSQSNDTGAWYSCVNSSDTRIFDDLDLSSVTNQKATFVILELVQTSTPLANATFIFRTNGDSEGTTNTSIGYAGLSDNQLTNSYVGVVTDENGIVEYTSYVSQSFAPPNISISIVFYLN